MVAVASQHPDLEPPPYCGEFCAYRNVHYKSTRPDLQATINSVSIPRTRGATGTESSTTTTTTTTTTTGQDLSAAQGLSVSGISAGGFASVQFHVAYSKDVIGAGVIAGGPYW